ncbi:hypothetical protein E2P64_08170 [Candidatus Bathyarchaeota archaeon]|nr:hypothetical protein E2P64_08170 [Candidatus Bathyarchaeota archaeon]
MPIVGSERKGDVYIWEFDKGIFDQMGAFLIGDYVYLPLSAFPGVNPPLFSEDHGIESEVGTSMPGIPVIFKDPDDSVQRYALPCVRLSREDPSPALERWASKHLKYRCPAPGAKLIQVKYNESITLEGYDKYEEQEGAWPYDIPYTITVEAAGINARTDAQVMLRYMHKKFPPYAEIPVVDSLGQTRKYTVFVEGPSELSQVADIRDRSIIYALSLRVSAEFDLADPKVKVAITAKPTINTYQQ